MGNSVMGNSTEGKTAEGKTADLQAACGSGVDQSGNSRTIKKASRTSISYGKTVK